MQGAHQDLVAKFQQLYFEEFGEHLSESQALDKLTRLTNVLRVLLTAPHADTPESPKAPFDGPPESDTLKTS
jgi:hypothetical protein